MTACCSAWTARTTERWLRISIPMADESLLGSVQQLQHFQRLTRLRLASEYEELASGEDVAHIFQAAAAASNMISAQVRWAAFTWACNACPISQHALFAHRRPLARLHPGWACLRTTTTLQACHALKFLSINGSEFMTHDVVTSLVQRGHAAPHKMNLVCSTSQHRQCFRELHAYGNDCMGSCSPHPPI